MGGEESRGAKATGGSCDHYELFDGDLLEISGSCVLPQAYNAASGIKAARAFHAKPLWDLPAEKHRRRLSFFLSPTLRCGFFFSVDSERA